MGSILSKIADDMDDYESLCKRLGISEQSKMYDHRDKIFKKFNVNNVYDFNAEFNRLQIQGWDLAHIKDFYNIN